jgi:DMSO/TMAO reductase YedYZ heme-binding membrane subunit
MSEAEEVELSNSHRPVLSNGLRDWLAAAVWAAGWFVFTIAYHDWWRNKPPSWLTANECVALAAVFCLSTALAVGPLYRFGLVGPAVYRFRRSFGLMAAACILIHIGIAVFPLWGKYGFKWVGEHLLCFSLGVLAALHLLGLSVLSWPAAYQRLGPQRWWSWQRTAWVALVLGLAHFMVLGKLPKWIEWFQKRDFPAPPATVWAALAGALVLVLRLFDRLRGRSPEGHAG